jgi:hypothetical protein
MIVQITRTLVVLIASALVVGATWLLTPASNGNEGRRPPPREGQTAPDGAPRRERGGREGGREGGGFNVFGLGHVMRDLVLVTVVTVIFVSVERSWAKRNGATLSAE